MTRLRGPFGRQRRHGPPVRYGRRLFGAVGAFLLLMALTLPATAGPVGTAAGFEDDDGNLAPEAPINFDWNSFAPLTWTGTAPYRQAEKVVSGWTFKGIQDAQAVTTDTAFAGGTKQDDDCASVITAKAPNKDDLKRIYLTTKVVGGDTYLMLAWVRIPQNTPSPSAHVGFEFNQGETSCGTGSPLVEREEGDLLFVYDFEGGTEDPVITVREWVLTGTCEVGSSTAPCWGPATNLTALGYAEAKVNTTISVSDALAPSAPPSESLGIKEFGEAGINLTDAGIIPANECVSFGTASAVSRTSGNSGTAQMKDLAGPAPFSLQNCGTVTIRKVTDPTPDPTDTSFGFDVTYVDNPDVDPSSFSLKDGESEETINVLPGTDLTATEDDPSGDNFELVDITCTGTATNVSTDLTTREAEFDLAAGQSITCTFTNKLLQGAIRIHKADSKTGDDLAGATFEVRLASDDSLVAELTTDATGYACVDELMFDDYTVTETAAPSGYVIDDATDHTVTVDNAAACDDSTYVGEDLSFTNTPTADIQVRFRDGGSGVTSAVITCDNVTGDLNTDDTTGWDETSTITGIEAPVTVTCEIEIDP